MAFTYTEDLTVARDFVRFHTGQVRADDSLLSDAEIAALLATEPTREHAVVAALEGLLARLSVPDVRLDWLTVNHTAARDGLARLLASKRAAFGLGAVRAAAVPTTRGD